MQNLIQHIQSYVHLSDSDIKRLNNSGDITSIKKKGFLLKEGEVCQTNYFVSQGCLRMYFIKENGTEQITQFTLSAWCESPLFTQKEKTLLAITDEVTLISDHGLKDETFETAGEYFTNNEIAQIIMQIATVNIWNRIAISTHMFHEE